MDKTTQALKNIIESSFSKNSAKEPVPKNKLDSIADNIDAEIELLGNELADLLKNQSGTLNSAIDPQILAVGAKPDALYVAKGAVTFSQYRRSIIVKIRVTTQRK